MSFPAVHFPHAIVFPGGDITQFTEFSPNRNFDILRQKSSGEAAPQFSGIIKAAPATAFATPQLKVLCDILTNSGIAIGYSAASTGTVSIFYRKGANRGMREAVASTVHDKFTLANNAFAYLESIEAIAGSIASAKAMLKAVSADGQNPFVHAGGVALSGTSAVGAVFTLGPQKVNGTAINSVVRAALNVGIRAGEDMITDGWAYSQYASIDDVEPELIIETNDISVMDNFEEPVAVTALTSYFRKLGQNAMPVADITAAHIKITATQGMAVATEGSGLIGRYTLRITIDKPDASTFPFTINTASAVS